MKIQDCARGEHGGILIMLSSSLLLEMEVIEEVEVRNVSGEPFACVSLLSPLSLLLSADSDVVSLEGTVETLMFDDADSTLKDLHRWCREELVVEKADTVTAAKRVTDNRLEETDDDNPKMSILFFTC
jgi:hypothetical protein